MGGAELAAGSVVAPIDDGDLELPAGHIQHLWGVVEDLVRGDQAERPAHELNDRAQAHHGRADAQPGEPRFGNGRVDHPLRAELLEHAPADLVGPLVLGHLLTHEEDAGIAAHLFAHPFSQGVTEFDLSGRAHATSGPVGAHRASAAGLCRGTAPTRRRRRPCRAPRIRAAATPQPT